MMPSLRLVVPGLFSAEECVATIAAAERAGFEAMGSRYPDAYRNNDRGVLDHAGLAATLFERLSPSLPATWEEDGARWRLRGLNSRFRFCRYRAGQQFTRHRDGAWSPAPGLRSWLTVMLYLNDASEFTGGATRFDTADGVDAVAPRTGQGIVFDHRLWHDGEAVRAGTKYVMRTDVLYGLDRPAEVRPLAANGLLTCDRVLEGHTGYVWTVRRLADGSLISGSRDGTVRRWGEENQVIRAGLPGSATAVIEVEGAIWVGGRDGRLDDGHRRWHAHEGVVLGLERAGDGAVISCGADGRVRRWSPTGEPCGELARHPGWVWAVSVEGDEVRAAVEPTTAIAPGCRGDRYGQVTVAGGRSWRAHEGAVTAILTLGPRYVTGGEDGALRLWTGLGELLGEGRHRDFVRSLVQLGPASFASGSYDATVAVWRVSGSDRELRPTAAAGR